MMSKRTDLKREKKVSKTRIHTEDGWMDGTTTPK